MEANKIMELFKKGLFKLIFQKLAEREKDLSQKSQRILELLRQDLRDKYEKELARIEKKN